MTEPYRMLPHATKQERADPHLGTGTIAVAAKLLVERAFVGCDIDEQQVRTARYRVATEKHESFSLQINNSNPSV